MKRPVFTGLCTALVTPFRDDGVNYEMLEALIERQITAGADAIVLAGTTGESPTLTDAEKLEIFRIGVNTAAGRTKIIAGIVAEVVMVLGYFGFEGFLYGFVESAVNIPANAVQGVAGLLIGLALSKIFEKTNLFT